MIELIDKIKPKNNGDFALVDAHEVCVDTDTDKRLDELIEEGIGGEGFVKEYSTMPAAAELVVIPKDPFYFRTLGKVTDTDKLGSTYKMSATAMEGATPITATVEGVEITRYVLDLEEESDIDFTDWTD